MASLARRDAGEQVGNNVLYLPAMRGSRACCKDIRDKTGIDGPVGSSRAHRYCCAGSRFCLLTFCDRRPAERRSDFSRQMNCVGPIGRKCADNPEIVRNYKGWLDVQVACRIAAAIETAKYGTRTWPFVPFQGFSEGKTRRCVRGGRGY